MRKFLTQSDHVVPWHYPRVLLETAAALGVSRTALLAGTGLSVQMFDSADSRLSYEQYDLLIDNALRLSGEGGLGLDVGRHVGSTQLGALGLAIASSTTLGDALGLLLRYARIVAPAWDLCVSIDGTTAFLTAREAIPRGRHRVFATEVLLVCCTQQARALRRGSFPLRTIAFGYAEPPHAQRYAEAFGVPVTFGAEVTRAEFDANLLCAPLPFTDPATARLTASFCEHQLTAEDINEGLVSRVRTLLYSASPPPSIEELARALQTSGRTLSRHFQKMGTSYRMLLEEARRERALKLARSGHSDEKTIAAALGFDNLRSFRRAFRRWTGQRPEAIGADDSLFQGDP